MDQSKQNLYKLIVDTVLIPMNHLIKTMRCRLSVVFLSGVIIAACGVANSQEYDSNHVQIPPGLPSSSTREILFQDATSWLEEVDRKTLDVSQVEAVTVEGNIDQELMEFVASYPKAFCLHVIEPPDNIDLDQVMSPLSKMKNLRILKLSMVRVNPQECKFLADLIALSDFRCDMFLFENDLYSLGALPELSTLEISSVVGEARASPRPEGQFVNLQELKLGSPRALRYFERSMKLRKVQVRDRVTKEDVAFISRFESLQKVSLTVSKSDLKVVIELLRELKHLETIHLAVVPTGKSSPRRRACP